jgi:hypothetical protein
MSDAFETALGRELVELGISILKADSATHGVHDVDRCIIGLELLREATLITRSPETVRRCFAVLWPFARPLTQGDAPECRELMERMDLSEARLVALCQAHAN